MSGGAGKRRIELDDGVYLVDLAVYLAEPNALIIADPHLGYEAALTREGLLLPKGHLDRVLERLTRILKALTQARKRPATIVINGDLKHQHGPISPEERSEALKFIDFLQERSQKVVIIKGNHDMQLNELVAAQEQVQAQAQVEVNEAVTLDGFWIVHGHVLPEDLPGSAETIIIGHEHPALSLRDPITGRTEIYKCFLKGKFRNRTLVVQPSFNLLVKGSNLAQEHVISPFINESRLAQFEVYPISDDGHIYRFGRLAELV
ncbi:MAG: metallophosphoesterase [Candidatus Bipolaricaulia bacterium]